jgi:hypothetical protein
MQCPLACPRAAKILMEMSRTRRDLFQRYRPVGPEFCALARRKAYWKM